MFVSQPEEQKERRGSLKGRWTHRESTFPPLHSFPSSFAPWKTGDRFGREIEREGREAGNLRSPKSFKKPRMREGRGRERNVLPGIPPIESWKKGRWKEKSGFRLRKWQTRNIVGEAFSSLSLSVFRWYFWYFLHLSSLSTHWSIRLALSFSVSFSGDYGESAKECFGINYWRHEETRERERENGKGKIEFLRQLEWERKRSDVLKWRKEELRSTGNRRTSMERRMESTLCVLNPNRG